MPIVARTLRQAALDYIPTLNVDGRAQRLVLSMCDGTQPVHVIAHLLQNEFPDRFSEPDETVRFVQTVIRRLA
jgi:hypothetical protein